MVQDAGICAGNRVHCSAQSRHVCGSAHCVRFGRKSREHATYQHTLTQLLTSRAEAVVGRRCTVRYDSGMPLRKCELNSTESLASPIWSLADGTSVARDATPVETTDASSTPASPHAILNERMARAATARVLPGLLRWRRSAGSVAARLMNTLKYSIFELVMGIWSHHHGYIALISISDR